MRVIMSIFTVFVAVILIFILIMTFKLPENSYASQEDASVFADSISVNTDAENSPASINNEDLEMLREIDSLEMMELLENLDLFTDIGMD